MRKAQQDLLLSTAVAMVLAAGCAPQAPPKPTAPAISPTEEAPTDRAAIDPKPVDKSPSRPPDESVFAGASTAELVEKLGSSEGEAAAVVLAKRGGSEISESLLSTLKHRDWQVRARAAFALGLMGKEAAAAKAALEQAAAEDAEQTVRDAAAFALDAIAESK